MGTTVSKKSYDRAFKERAVKLSHERDNVRALAAELGISSERIYKWRAEFARHGEASFQGHGVERLSEEGKRVKELEKKLRNTELELEILKKAIAVLHNTGCAQPQTRAWNDFPLGSRRQTKSNSKSFNGSKSGTTKSDDTKHSIT